MPLKTPCLLDPNTKFVCERLQTGAVDDLVVDSHLPAFIVDDQDANAATTVGEALAEAAEQAALVQDRQALLDITSLSHGNNTAIVPDVQDTVLLEHRAEHVLDDHTWTRIADERTLLVQLLSEEVHTEVPVLAGLSRSGDTDNLARAALQNQEIANADVVARDGDGVWRAGRATGHVTGRHDRRWWGLASPAVLNYDVLLFTRRQVVQVVVVLVLAVEDAVGSAVQTVAETVVLAVFVVISHVKAVLAVSLTGWWINRLLTDPVVAVVLL